MKYHIPLIIFTMLSLVACKSTSKLKSPEAQFSFLIGDWAAQMDGYISEESWTSAKGRLESSSQSIQNKNEIISSETAVIKYEKGYYFYIPTVLDRNKKVSVPFKITSYTNQSFVAENPEHDFPKRITYTRIDGDHIRTVVDDGPKNPKEKYVFNFVRKK
ncbi:MAG TPA: DUF6265 family protein [Saprospiraceae bacterium]|nr:DUF6265 family protein [Saprospiraceae bacterium]HQW55580.1 DUF6265 family protein [Saprospiraceae bacterium]